MTSLKFEHFYTWISILDLFSIVAGEGCSTPWMNRDDPSGVGDYEITDANDNPAKPAKYMVQAQQVGYAPIYNSALEVRTALGQNVTYVVNSFVQYGVGMYCRNDQNGNNCMDYQARFCCGKFNLFLHT